MRSGKFFLLFSFSLLFSLLIFGKVGATTCTTETTTTIQSIVQYKCTLGACGGTIEFKKRIAERECQGECEVCDGEVVNCDWSCNPWKFRNETVVKTYDTSQTPWLVCTYRYDQLTDTEKNRIKNSGGSLNYPYTKIICEKGSCAGGDEACLRRSCPNVDEINWIPPVLNSDSYDDFYNYVAGRDYRFFEVAQITCWGRCLGSAENPHYFGGSINPKRDVGGKIESEEQDPSEVRLPAKFGWEFEKEKWGLNEWEEAMKYAKEKCKSELKEGRTCPYPQPPDKEGVKEIWINKFWSGQDKFKIQIDSGHSLSRDLGVGSFHFKIENLERFLPIAEGEKIPEWQTPASGGRDVEWTRRDMYDYFDYYFLNDTSFSGNSYRYPFSGYFERGGRFYLYIYSPSQDTKENYLWVEYKDPNENNLTKQIRIQKNQQTHGPCEITPFSDHSLEVYPCCGTDNDNCYPIEKKWKFHALGPEIKSILGIRVEEAETIYPFHLYELNLYFPPRPFKEEGKYQKLNGKIYRFIDIDWDRAWPSKNKREEILREQSGSILKDYFYVGGVKFEKTDGGERNVCEKECRRRCDRKCLEPGTCEAQCLRECDRARENSLNYCNECALKRTCDLENCRERVEGNYKACKEVCKENFKKYREGCPNCKGEDKGMGCIVCKECFKEESCTFGVDCMEKNPCLPVCVEECYYLKEREGIKLEEIKDCEEVCSQLDEKTKFAAINKECSLLPETTGEERRIKRKCLICQECKFKADFLEIEWCPNYGGGFGAISSVYKERYDKKFPVEEFYKKEKEVKKCEDPRTPSLCRDKPCDCFKYDSKGDEILERDECPTKILDEFLFHPALRPVEPSATTTYFECKLYPSKEKEKCYALPKIQSLYPVLTEELLKHYYSTRIAIQKLKVTSDVYKEFGGVNRGEEIYQIPISLFDETIQPNLEWWEWDLPLRFFSSLVFNGVIVGKCEEQQCQGSSLRWDFKIETLPKDQICDFAEKNCYGEEEEEYPFCWQIRKEPLKTEKLVEKELEDETKGLNRIQVLTLFPERIFSFRLKIKEIENSSSSYLEYLPKRATQSPIAAGPKALKFEEKPGTRFFSLGNLELPPSFRECHWKVK
jgi:hypothetical protein